MNSIHTTTSTIYLVQLWLRHSSVELDAIVASLNSNPEIAVKKTILKIIREA